jgi:hypothetical protein
MVSRLPGFQSETHAQPLPGAGVVVARLKVEQDGNLGQDPYSFLFFSPLAETDPSLASSQPGHFTCLSDKLLVYANLHEFIKDSHKFAKISCPRDSSGFFLGLRQSHCFQNTHGRMEFVISHTTSASQVDWLHGAYTSLESPVQLPSISQIRTFH